MLDLSAAPKLKPAFLLNNVVVAAYVKHIGKFNPQEQLDTFFQSQATQNGKKSRRTRNCGISIQFIIQWLFAATAKHNC